MDKNEIKKALYKENPTAYMGHIKDGNIYYAATIRGDVEESVIFIVPITDIGSARFDKEMEAKHLIRWIV